MIIACFEVEAEGLYVTDTVTDETNILDRANKLYNDMRKRTDGSISLRLVIQIDSYNIIVNMA